ncbi:MAG: dTDP-glucose 4,6-dehydratase [Rhodobacteraceae bacterium]|nr:dTDP-glucose 4,6-dehydratase [Paracoccaceae bacterium]
MKLLVTGGAGFIGSAVVRRLIRQTPHSVINLDKLTYAASPEALEVCAASDRYAFERIDVTDAAALAEMFSRQRPDGVLHLAAESHVDRSIDAPETFIQTNILGTYHLLQAARGYYERLTGEARAAFRFHHVSTDEVFGALGPGGAAFHEVSPYRPNSPYSAAKAASDHLVRAWGATYGLPVVTSNCSNSYGPWQYPEKLIPVLILNAAQGLPLPIYGKGDNIRDWLYVEDHAEALITISESGRIGETYAVSGGAECTNLQVAEAVCREMDALHPENAPHNRLIQFVEDRPGHDFRYALNSGKIQRELGWRPRRTFDQGLSETVRWYLDNQDWGRRRVAAPGDRLGLHTPPNL